MNALTLGENIMSKIRPWGGLLVAGIITISGEASAADPILLINDYKLEYKVSLGYVAAMRVASQSDALINGPSTASTAPTTVNIDDGDRNFKKGSLINNRMSALAEALIRNDQYGVSLSGSGFYDLAYSGRNDNDSPSTVNKSGPNDEFTSATRHYDGHRIRLLDAYAFGTWNLLDGVQLNLRVGQQVVAWGEALFFPGISAAQGTFDGTKSNIPGAEVKDQLLPSPMAMARFQLPHALTLSGYYKFKFAPTEINPQGDYFASSDGVGPGATFLYGAPNPLYPLFGALIPGTPQNINLQRTADDKAPNHGEYGVQLQSQVTNLTTLAMSYVRYHQGTPATVLNPGPLLLVPAVTNVTPQLAQLAGLIGLPPSLLTQGITTQTLGQTVPNSYTVKYFPNISLYGVSFSSILGDIQVAGEASFRDGARILVTGDQQGFAPARVSEVKLNSIYLFHPNAIWSDATFTGEVGATYVNSVGGLKAQDGTMNNNVSLGDSRHAVAYSLTFTPERVGDFSGIGITLPITFAHLVQGAPAVSGSLGNLVGKGDMRASVGVGVNYLQKLDLGIVYSAFLGGADPVRRPFQDRDYVALTAKYGF